MEQILKKLEEQQKQIDAIYQSVEKTRKYFLWTGIITLVVIIVPLLFIPFFLGSALQGLTGTGIIEGI